MKKCNNCGYKTIDDASFCTRCGGSSFKFISQKPRFIVSLAKALCYIAAWLLVQFTVAFVYSFTFIFSLLMRQSEFILDERIIEEAAMTIIQNMSMISLLSNALYVVMLMLFFAARKKNIFSEVRAVSVPLKTVPLCAVIGCSANVITNVVISVIPWPDSFVTSFSSHNVIVTAGNSLPVMIMSICVMTGIVEEILFRGLFITRLRRSSGRAVSVIVSSAVFALCHANPIAISYAFFIGVIFGIIFLKYDSMLPTAVCHIFYNLTSIAMTFWADNIILLFAAFFVSCALFTGSMYLTLRKQHGETDNLKEGTQNDETL